MTLFIASLFLPYTVNFGDETSPELSRQSTAPADETEQTSTPTAVNNDARIVPVSIREPPLSTLPKTPGATTNLETIFQPHVERPFSLTIPTPRSKKGLSASTSRSNLSGLCTLRDPHHMPLHSPAGSRTPGDNRSSYWNQPTSKAAAAPPSDVRHFNTRALDVYNDMILPPKPARRLRSNTRKTSNEKKYTEDNYTIEHARHGNSGLFHVIDAVSEAGDLTDKTWVGTLGMPTDTLDDHLKSVIAECLEDDYESLAIYVSDGDFDGHYEHFCKTMLWPIFHYQVPDHPKSKAYQDHSWVYYVKVNQAFADRIVKNYKKGDTIWIHDYHLLLLPGMLREKLPEAKIGFFMHTAFPSSEVFRVLANRIELCEGLLGANMVSFQTDEYAQHFLQTCSRILNVEINAEGVILEDGRILHVDTIPIGISPGVLDKMRALPEVADWTTQIAERYAGKRIIVARDKLESIRGIRQKMLSYELFLKRYPEFANDTVLIQIATSGCEDGEISATIADIVTRINSSHSTLAHQPVVYLRQDIDHSQYLALLSVAECLLITCLREGMNLTVHEYVYCQDAKFNNRKHNPLILSEFTGSASLFGKNALLVNPWDHGAVADAIKKALSMPLEERERRWSNMYGMIMQQNGSKWYSSSMKLLEHAWEDHTSRVSTSVPRLSVSDLVSTYTAAKRRLLILDYEGTLASWSVPSIASSVPKRLTDTLNDLVDDPKNTVYVMSSRMPEELERLFVLVAGVGLIAENGAFVREASSCDEWLELTDMNHVSKWKKGVKDILKHLVERIENSRIEERHSSLIFDYSKVDDKPSAIKHAADCANSINETCANLSIHAVPIENGVCVCAKDLNKASAAALIDDGLRKEATEGMLPYVDFLLVIGDSREDEYVFEWAKEQEEKGMAENVFTVTLGSRNTAAAATLTQGVTGVVSALRKLAASG